MLTHQGITVSGTFAFGDDGLVNRYWPAGGNLPWQAWVESTWACCHTPWRQMALYPPKVQLSEEAAVPYTRPLQLPLRRLHQGAAGWRHGAPPLGGALRCPPLAGVSGTGSGLASPAGLLHGC